MITNSLGHVNIRGYLVTHLFQQRQLPLKSIKYRLHTVQITHNIVCIMEVNITVLYIVPQ